jgi:hypothetical protein
LSRLCSNFNRRTIAVLFATALCSATLPEAAPAAQKAIWGPVSFADGESAFPMYKRLGVDTYQIQVNWDRVAPTRPADPTNSNDPAYSWPAELTTTSTEAARHGIRIALLVTGTPGWANGGKSRIWAPSDPQDFAAFLTAAAKRYSNVRTWMIWGEPNMALRFQPQATNDSTSARTYAMLDAAYGALKALTPRNIVVGGMTWSGGDVKPAQFAREMRMPDGRPPRLDWFGHNPYPFRFPDLRRDPIADFRDISDLDTFIREIDAVYTDRPVKLWLSEYMIQSDQRSGAFDLFVSQAQQAAWLRAGFTIANRLADRVAGMGWFTLVDQAPSTTSSHWGLLTHDLKPKPAWNAFYDVPSERFAPRVTAPRTASVRTLRGPGLGVRLRLRYPGGHSVQLRRGGRIVLVRRTTKSALVRLRLRSVRRGAYTVRVVSPRGVSLVRTVAVR